MFCRNMNFLRARLESCVRHYEVPMITKWNKWSIVTAIVEAWGVLHTLGSGRTWYHWAKNDTEGLVCGCSLACVLIWHPWHIGVGAAFTIVVTEQLLWSLSPPTNPNTSCLPLKPHWPHQMTEDQEMFVIFFPFNVQMWDNLRLTEKFSEQYKEQCLTADFSMLG